jgi:aromatic ring-opening dioxygenase LigB subunit
MALLWGSILPHGSQAVPGLEGQDGDAFLPTRRGLELTAAALAAHPVDVVVVATPHGFRAEGGVTVSDSEYVAGTLKSESARLEARYAVDRTLARRIAEAAEARGMAAPLIAYGASSGPASCLPLDWGAQVPLTFLAPPGPEAPQVIVLCPSRTLGFEALAQFGEAVAEAALASSRRVGFVASADQCHAHRADGPYGFDPAAAELDAVIVQAVQGDRLEDLFLLNPAFIAAGKPDSLWQMAILAGVRRHVRWSHHFVAYDVPTYFGMLSAYYLPIP